MGEIIEYAIQGVEQFINWQVVISSHWIDDNGNKRCRVIDVNTFEETVVDFKCLKEVKRHE